MVRSALLATEVEGEGLDPVEHPVSPGMSIMNPTTIFAHAGRFEKIRFVFLLLNLNELIFLNTPRRDDSNSIEA